MQHALARSLRPQLRVRVLQARALSTPPPPPSKPTAGPSQPYRHEKPPPPPQSWLTRQLMRSPTAMSVFMKVFGALGYGSSKQVAARRALAIYENLCAVRAEEEQDFWQHECHLPPTFQSWFTVTNLHVWIITTRLRALPSPHGQEHIQGLIDHFFLDVEDRIRQVLQPQPSSSSSPSTRGQAQQQAKAYYAAMTSPKSDVTQNRRRGRAPEALVTKQMKIFREQWAGLGMAFDLGLIRGDAEMAGAIWRNLLGARGAQGIMYGAEGAPAFRRSINPSGEVEKYGKIDDAARRREELRDDGSGVHDFAPTEVDKYVRYPETMATLVAYIRSEIRRLAELSDDEIAGPRGAVGTEGAGIQQLKFGKISDAQRVVADVVGA